MNASIGVALRQLAGVERAQPGILAHDLGDGVGGRRVVGADQHVAVDRLVEVAELLGRQVVEGRGDAGSRAPRPARCAATDPRGGTSGWNSLPTRTSALAIEMTTLPAAGARPTCAVVRRAVPRRGDDDDVGVGRAPRCRRTSIGEVAVGPAGRGCSSTVSIARYFEREPIDDVVADRRQAGARAPLPAGPVPPRMPIRIGD